MVRLAYLFLMQLFHSAILGILSKNQKKKKNKSNQEIKIEPKFTKMRMVSIFSNQKTETEQVPEYFIIIK